MVMVIAHRGASGYRPEHTAAAVRLGFELGADAVEPDLVPTRDGVLVVRHEPSLAGTTDVAGRAEFAARRRAAPVSGLGEDGGGDGAPDWFTTDFTWEELATLRARERIPALRPDSTRYDGAEPMLRFGELLDLLPPDATLVAELKHPAAFAALGYDLAGMFLAELGSRVPADRLVVESFELGVLGELAARGCAGHLVYLSEEAVDAAALPAAIGGVSYAKALLLAPGGAGLVAAAHAAGRTVYTWTLRPENAFLDPRHRAGDDPAAWGDWRGEFAAILATGVDGVFADHPDLARAALAGA
jgi:glycerophosphoryl diester phosphodiesterase